MAVKISQIESFFLSRQSDKNLIRWHRKEFEDLENGCSITDVFSPGSAIKFKKYGITKKARRDTDKKTKTYLSSYGKKLLNEIIDEKAEEETITV